MAERWGEPAHELDLTSRECFACTARNSELDQPYLDLKEQGFVMADRYPVIEGHTLFFTNMHVDSLWRLEDTAYFPFMSGVRRLATATALIYPRRRIAIFSSGKEVPQHVHVHVLPVKTGLKKTFESLSLIEREELGGAHQAELLRKLAEVMNAE